MSEAIRMPPPSVSPKASLPAYLPGKSAGSAVARFRSGKKFELCRDRVRHYPGLSSLAPDTSPFYSFAHGLGLKGRVLDLGSGAGVGVGILAEVFEQVVAIDIDDETLRFAEALYPMACYETADLHASLPSDGADAAFVCDVLGHLTRPRAALQHAGRALRPGSTLLVAEPSSFPTQVLAVPQRRAFGKRELKRLLLQSGFCLDHFIVDQGTFICGLGVPSEDRDVLQLSEAFALLDKGQSAAAERLFDSLKTSRSAEVALEALVACAELCMRRGDGDGAARTFLEVRKRFPEDARPLAGLAEVTLAMGDPEQALELATSGCTIDPTNARAAAAAASAAEAAQHPESLAIWQIALNLAPDDLGVAAGLARTAAAHDDFDLGIRSLERVRNYDSGLNASFHLTLAWLLLSSGRTKDAEVEARFATALGPNEPGLAELWGALKSEGAEVMEG